MGGRSRLYVGVLGFKILRILSETDSVPMTVLELAQKICGGGRKCYRNVWKGAKDLARRGLVAEEKKDGTLYVRITEKGRLLFHLIF